MLAAAASSAIFSVNLSCFLSISLKKIIDVFKLLQLVAHLTVIISIASANSEAFFGFLLEISNFDIFDPTEIYCQYLSLEEDDPLSSSFEATGYDYSNVILNLGMNAFLILIVTPGITLIYITLSNICCFKRLKDYYKKQKDRLIFNGIVTFLEAEILSISACCCINLYQIHRDSEDRDNLGYYASVILLTLVIIFMLILSMVLLIKIDKLDEYEENHWSVK